jgi:hypothetical protein
METSEIRSHHRGKNLEKEHILVKNVLKKEFWMTGQIHYLLVKNAIALSIDLKISNSPNIIRAIFGLQKNQNNFKFIIMS